MTSEKNNMNYIRYKIFSFLGKNEMTMKEKLIICILQWWSYADYMFSSGCT